MKNLASWTSTTLKNYKKTNNPDDNEVHHVLDYLKAHPKLRLQRLSYPQALAKAEAWTKTLIKKNKGVKNCGQEELIISFPDGMRFVRLLDDQAKAWEGTQMGHCVSSYRTHKGIYSLRDARGFPHATAEVRRGKIYQLVGKSNKALKKSYFPYFKYFIDKTKFDVSYCSAYLRYLGLFRLPRSSVKVVDNIADGITKVKHGGRTYYSCKKLRLKSNPKIDYNKKSFFEDFFIDKESAWSKAFEFLGASMNEEIIKYAYLKAEQLGKESSINRNFQTELFFSPDSCMFVINKYVQEENVQELEKVLKFVYHNSNISYNPQFITFIEDYITVKDSWVKKILLQIIQQGSTRYLELFSENFFNRQKVTDEQMELIVQYAGDESNKPLISYFCLSKMASYLLDKNKIKEILSLIPASKITDEDQIRLMEKSLSPDVISTLTQNEKYKIFSLSCFSKFIISKSSEEILSYTTNGLPVLNVLKTFYYHDDVENLITKILSSSVKIENYEWEKLMIWAVKNKNKTLCELLVPSTPVQSDKESERRNSRYLDASYYLNYL